MILHATYHEEIGYGVVDDLMDKEERSAQWTNGIIPRCGIRITYISWTECDSIGDFTISSPPNRTCRCRKWATSAWPRAYFHRLYAALLRSEDVAEARDSAHQEAQAGQRDEGHQRVVEEVGDGDHHGGKHGGDEEDYEGQDEGGAGAHVLPEEGDDVQRHLGIYML